jgi:hypothetical protein
MCVGKSENIGLCEAAVGTVMSVAWCITGIVGTAGQCGLGNQLTVKYAKEYMNYIAGVFFFFFAGVSYGRLHRCSHNKEIHMTDRNNTWQ